MCDTCTPISPRRNKLARALARMARALDAMVELAGRYERATDAYQDALLEAYDAWAKKLLRAIGKETDMERARQVIVEQMPDLSAALRGVAQAGLPDAVNAMSDAYVPSADAYRLIADAITQNNGDIETRLVPVVADALLRAVLDGKPLADAAAALDARVAQYAGAFWVLIQRFIGDFVAQMETTDDAIYPVRWICNLDDATCDACREFAGEYKSYNDMLTATAQSVPGYFFGYRNGSACWGNCRCHLEIQVNGRWKRI